ncbi:4-hydroxy-2-oxovalerate aldolase [Nitrosopumilus maritimus]|uniref:Pyruvate carboxyltransferase n=1 Tax=Nitrosopumilus maritimus (strain SCM1) TaxID=436308 RepID=A9A1R9_NITMS|nr:4-hydroxy-2-oxovalerate aldolase [Nitrosopumilus maritimus]ABX12040.1 pyruvate carboxyltransferase [Nitrosopumilus maritimus SCM1]
MSKKVQILDTTLRDGSYSVNFSFTSSDTSIICSKLEKSGIKLIEVGHGLGFNASNSGYGKSTQSDEEYMIAAKESLSKSMYGMFCIPGIAKLSDLELAKKHGMGFIRVGTDVTKVHQSEKFIKKAKNLGFFVASNFMKSYVMPPDKFASIVKQSEEFGTDMVYIVDSAGGMFSSDLLEYYNSIRNVSEIPLGFHGHDNLGMAISNSLYAADLGMEYIDSSLQGIGRSSGNACTEVLVMALKKKGFKIDVDFHSLFEAGQECVYPLINNSNKLPLDIVSGYADFHSSYMHHIMKYSSKFKVDPLLLIIEYSKINKIDIDEKKLEQIAKKLKRKQDIYTAKYRFNRYVGREQDN